MAEHLLLFPDREVAEEIADELAAEGFGDVRVVRIAHAGEDDSEDHEWAVHLTAPVGGGADLEGAHSDALRQRFEALAAAHEGWYDPDPAGG